MAKVAVSDNRRELTMADMKPNSWAILTIKGYLAYRDTNGKFYQITMESGRIDKISDDISGEGIKVSEILESPRTITFYL